MSLTQFIIRVYQIFDIINRKCKNDQEIIHLTLMCTSPFQKYYKYYIPPNNININSYPVLYATVNLNHYHNYDMFIS